MKKTTVNLLCILIIGILSCSIIVPGINISQAFIKGYNDGVDSEIVYTPVRVSYKVTDSEYFHPDKNIKSADGETYPFSSHSGILMVHDNKIPNWYFGVTLASFIAELVLFILLIVEFLQFIININHNRLFDHRNVKRLRRFGIYLIFIALLQCVLGICDDSVVNSLNISDSTVSLEASWGFPWGNLLIGMIALLMSQIWSIALEMKKEQDLTI